MKDGKVGKNNIAGNVYEILYDDIEKRSFDTLHIIEDKHKNCSKNKIKKYAWTKVSKQSNLEPKFSKRVVFKESGLDTENFIDNPKFCGNFANEIIDPAGRSPINIQKGDIIFPLGNNELVLEESFLTFFGFIGCSVKATRIKQQEYKYNINIKDLPVINGSASLFNNVRVSWFQGNNEKNQFIAKNPNLQKLQKARAIKNGLLLTKEMGDVLQVLIMLIWSLLNPGESYAMGTCDKVVFLQCMLLNLNCILTSAGEGSGETGKVRCIEYYEPKEYTLKDATLRFNTEKKNILKDNKSFIKLLTLLQENIHGTQIYISGVNEPYIFTKKFYTLIINDLNNINKLLEKMTINGLKNPDLIDKELQMMKENFVFKIFIRPVNNKFKMVLDKTYTHKNELWKKKIILQLNNSGSTFFEYVKRHNKEFIVEMEDTNKKRKRGGNKKKSNNSIYSISGRDCNMGGENSIQSFKDEQDDEEQEDEEQEYEEEDVENFLKTFEYDDTAYYFEEEGKNKINLYTELHKQIKEKLLLRRIDYFDDVIHHLYYHFYFENEVFYDTQLNTLIEDIIKELDITVTNKTIQWSNTPTTIFNETVKRQRIDVGGSKKRKNRTCKKHIKR